MTTNGTQQPVSKGIADPLQVSIPGGTQYDFFEFGCSVNVINVKQSANDRLTAEVTVFYPAGTPVISNARLDLFDWKARQGLMEQLAKLVEIYLPWGEILELAISATISQFRQNTESQAPVLTCLANVKAQPVSWLWEPYVPFRKVTLLEGDPGTGKSWVGSALATALSLSKGLPRQSELAQGETLILSAEDGLSDTIRPRLDRMGADISKIHAIDGLFSFDAIGLALLEQYLSDILPQLVIIDPIVAYLACDVDIHKANQVRQAMAHLARLADSYGSAILVIRHLTKGGSLKPIYRGLGSIDFTASARSVLLAGCDPDNPTVRGLVHIKCNLAPLGEAIGYELKEGNFLWTGQSDLTADRILQASDGGTARDEAINFLKEVLTGGAILSDEVTKQANANGISERTLKRAKKYLRVVSFNEPVPGKRGAGKWYCKLPTDGEKHG